MNCNDYQLLVAQSLDGEQDSALDRHLSTCAACQQLQRDLAADRAALLELDDVPELALNELHNRVMARIPSRRSKLALLWRGAAWAAAAVLIGILLLRERPDTPAPQQRLTVQVAPPQPNPQPAVRPGPRARHPVRIKTPEHPLMVKLETSDPNVVIYWMVDRNNGELE